MDLDLLLLFLSYFLIIFIALVPIAFFAFFVARHFRPARAVWITVCVVHLIAFLAFDYHHPEIPGNHAEPRFAEAFQWFSLLPTMIYCFPSSMLSWPLGAALNRVLCARPETCDSMLVLVPIWWLIPVTLGYLQWFALFPWLLKKFEQRSPQIVDS